MKLPTIKSKILFFIFLSTVIGCSHSDEFENKDLLNFTKQTFQSSDSVKFYSVVLSMRKIDSLTSNLNLKFSKRNALDL